MPVHGDQQREAGAGEPKGLESILRSVAHADRLAILRALLEADTSGSSTRTISQIARATDLDRFGASRHLATLVEAGLAERITRGAHADHRLRREPFEILDAWLVEFLA